MKKSNVFTNPKDVKCVVCGKNLIDDIDMSLVNIIQNMETHKIVKVCPCCKGSCDDKIERTAKENEISGWKDISDFTNPFLYIKHIMSVMNSMHNGNGFDNQAAFEDYKDLVLKMYPYVTRDMEEKENKRAILDNQFPF